MAPARKEGVELHDSYRRHRHRNPIGQDSSPIRSVLSGGIGYDSKLWRNWPRFGDFATTRPGHGWNRSCQEHSRTWQHLYGASAATGVQGARVAFGVLILWFPQGRLPTLAARRCCLVEDNAVNAFISAASLESMGVNSVHAIDGAQAVDVFRKGRFDAVLMDCEMPVMDGFDCHAADSRVRGSNRSAANSDHCSHSQRTSVVTANFVLHREWTTTLVSQSSCATPPTCGHVAGSRNGSGQFKRSSVADFSGNRAAA